jgi:membrane fusion protein (multidrug efflux system)
MKQNQLHAARLLALLPTAALFVAGCGHGPQGGVTPPAPEVGVVIVETGNLPLILEYTGRAAGSREVEVRARVSGILLERRYQEGRPVRQGDVLFRIDPEQYRAAAAQARAEVGVEHARLNEARRQKERVLQLVEKGLVSQMNRDEAISQFEVAEASVAAAEAKLRTAELNLGYTEVRAPIGGLTSHEARSEGSLVTAGADSSLLTRIVQVDPAYIEFSLPESDAALLRSRLVVHASSVSVRLLLETGAQYPEPARLGFLDTSVDPASGTVRARAVVDNRAGMLVPGQFLRVRVEGVTVDHAVAVPRRSVMSSAQGNFVWIVGAGDVVELRPVGLGGNVGDRELITSGLTGGERIVADGVLKVRPGAKVTIAKPAANAAGPAG